MAFVAAVEHELTPNSATARPHAPARHPATHRHIVFSVNPVRPFASPEGVPSRPEPHDCQRSLTPFAAARGSGSFAGTIFAIRQCSVCALGFTEPIPTARTAHLLYETRESNDFQPGDSSLVSRLKAFATRRDVRSFVRGLTLPDGPMLDFGCGNAAFASAMRQVLPTREVFGADLQDTPPAALSASNYLAYADLHTGSTKFAFILCRHVLEHSYDPVLLLEKLHNLLLPGGVLMLEVPALETAVAKLFGKYWDNFYVPYHPIHFTRESLHTTVSAADFSVLREGGAEMPKMGRSLHNLVGGSYHLGLFALGMLLHPLQIAIGMATRTSVCLRIWVQKPV